MVGIAEQAQSLYNKGRIDPITGKKATLDLKLTGYAIETYFTPIVTGKQKVENYIKDQLNATKKDVQPILKTYNKENGTSFTTTKTRGDFLNNKK